LSHLAPSQRTPKVIKDAPCHEQIPIARSRTLRKPILKRSYVLYTFLSVEPTADPLSSGSLKSNRIGRAASANNVPSTRTFVQVTHQSCELRILYARHDRSRDAFRCARSAYPTWHPHRYNRMAFTVALDVSCPVPKPVPESAARLIRAIIYAVLIRATD